MKIFRKTNSGKVYKFNLRASLEALPVGAYITLSPKETNLEQIKAAIKQLRKQGMRFSRHKLTENGVVCIQVAKTKQQ